ncbi:MoaD/ThiS family protein [Brachybacterium sp. EF45031]|uniref:MoaD/ThiS family protein n=1 Tax=Brachybacterium sillae TaxID=2810536 RepID=UPI00217EC0EE|nr:MoaD/ThiS family protein [Brachybacterium sillae]MCS6711380.1 MoaD/ThiS family protein [Brachybacterium sillae]
MVTVRLFAAAAAAVGARTLELPAPTLGALRNELDARTDGEGRRVLARSSLLVDGVSRDEASWPLPAGTRVDVLPPFAGG